MFYNCSNMTNTLSKAAPSSSFPFPIHFPLHELYTKGCYLNMTKTLPLKFYIYIWKAFIFLSQAPTYFSGHNTNLL